MKFLEFLKGVMSEDSGTPSAKRVVLFILIALFCMATIANLFYHKILESTLLNELYYLITTFVGAMVVEKSTIAIGGKKKDDTPTDETK
jgi:undecaprenyl pyrophosphate phosphatase UppP